MLGSERHMGNAVAHDSAQPRNLDTAGSQNLTSLGRRFDSTNYLAKTSDIVALMTLEHQTRMTNLMIRTAWDARVEAAQKGSPDPAAAGRVDADIEAMVTYMLFADET